MSICFPVFLPCNFFLSSPAGFVNYTYDDSTYFAGTNLAFIQNGLFGARLIQESYFKSLWKDFNICHPGSYYHDYDDITLDYVYSAIDHENRSNPTGCCCCYSNIFKKALGVCRIGFCCACDICKPMPITTSEMIMIHKNNVDFVYSESKRIGKSCVDEYCCPCADASVDNATHLALIDGISKLETIMLDGFYTKTSFNLPDDISSIDDHNEFMKKMLIESIKNKSMISNKLATKYLTPESKTTYGNFILDNIKLSVIHSRGAELSISNTLRSIRDSSNSKDSVKNIILALIDGVGIVGITGRIKTVESLQGKINKMISNNDDTPIYDIVGYRFYYKTDSFKTFSKILSNASNLQGAMRINSMILSHKLKDITSWFDFKVILQLRVDGLPVVEVQFVPVMNYITDSLLNGHDIHKEL